MAAGGLTGGIGAGIGYFTGPMVDIGGLMGKGVNAVMGKLPSIKATGEQKQKLESMLGQAHETPRPSEEELNKMTDGGKFDVHGDNGYEGSWTQSAASYVPSKAMAPEMPSWGSKKGGQAPTSANPTKQKEAPSNTSTSDSQTKEKKKPQKLEKRST